MDIVVPRTSAEAGTLRVWLRRVPVFSGTIYAFRVGPEGVESDPIGEAKVYGRGEGSNASEKVMLLFRLQRGKEEAPLQGGETLRLRVKSPSGDGFEDAKLDLLLVE